MMKLPYGWEWKTLGEICIRKAQYGSGAKKADFDGKVRYIRITDIDNDGNLKNEDPVSPSIFEEDCILEKNDLLFARSGSVGRTYLHSKQDIKYQFAGYLIRFKINPKIADARYVFYITKSKYYLSWVESLKRTVTISNINAKEYSSFELPIPPLPIQQKIVSILERAETLKQKRDQVNEETNKIILSLFYKMFGNPIKNEKKWTSLSLKEIAQIQRDSVLPENINSNDLYVGLEHIESNSGKIINRINAKEAELKSNKFRFDKNCILYGKLRPYLNKIALPNFDGICSTDILPIKPIPNKTNKYFIAYLLKNPYFIRKATDMSEGANLPRISPKALESFNVLCPPLELQNQFASIVKKVESIKQKQSTLELNTLFDALMQKAFKGELAE